MASRYSFVDPLDAFLDRLPRFIARPIRSAIVFIYFHWKLAIVACQIFFVAGVLGFVIWSDLPRPESVPALFLLAALATFACWQWVSAVSLRARLRSLEQDLLEEDTTEYEYPNGDPVED